MTSIPFAVMSLAAIFALVLAGSFFFTYYIVRRIHQALPPTGRFVSVPGGTVHVHEQGNGPALLLIHGLAGHMRHYTYGVTERLASDYRVIVVDRPGSGYSLRHPGTPADLSTQARTLAGVIDQLQLGPVVVVGHSLGGAVALALALEHPQRISGLALIAPLTHLTDEAQVPAAFKALTISSLWLRKLFAWTLAIPASIARRRVVLDQVFGPDEVPSDFATRGGGLLGLRPSQFLAASADLQALPDRLPGISSRYGELRIPVSVLFGRHDRILDWERNGQALAKKAADATLKLVDGGHMLPVTNPELAASFIRETAKRAEQHGTAMKPGAATVTSAG